MVSIAQVTILEGRGFFSSTAWAKKLGIRVLLPLLESRLTGGHGEDKLLNTGNLVR